MAWRDVATMFANEAPRIVVLGPIGGAGVNGFQIPGAGCLVTVFTESVTGGSSVIAAGDLNTVIVRKAEAPSPPNRPE